MNKPELIATIAEQGKITKKDAENHLNILGRIVSVALQSGGDVTLPFIGKLSTKNSAPRKGRNPHTGDAIDIPAKIKVCFKASNDLVKTVNT